MLSYYLMTTDNELRAAIAALDEQERQIVEALQVLDARLGRVRCGK
jgi:hypothetical protein